MLFTKSELNIIYGLLKDLSAQEITFRISPDKFREIMVLQKRVFDAMQAFQGEPDELVV